MIIESNADRDLQVWLKAQELAERGDSEIAGMLKRVEDLNTQIEMENKIIEIKKYELSMLTQIYSQLERSTLDALNWVIPADGLPEVSTPAKEESGS